MTFYVQTTNIAATSAAGITLSSSDALEVVAGVSVSAANYFDGIDADGGGNYISIDGAVFGSVAIYFTGTGSSNIVNIGTQGVASGGNDGIAFGGQGGNWLTNDGQISGLSGSGVSVNGGGDHFVNHGTISGFDFGIEAGGNDTISNTGTISSQFDEAISENGGGNNLTNSGTITSTIANSGEVIYFVGGGNNVTSSGLISGPGSAVLCTDGQDSITNTGSMLGGSAVINLQGTLGDNTVHNDGHITGNANVVTLDGNSNTLVNTNLIDATAATAIDVEGDLSSIDNSGTISAASAAIYLNSTAGNASQITNTSTGLIDVLSGPAIQTAAGDETVTNDGTIIGDVQLGNGNDIFDGSNGVIHGTIYGQAGGDTLTGGAGNDTLDGGAGADSLDGGGGNNTASYSDAASAVTADLSLGEGLEGDAQGDVLTNIQNLAGSAYDDTLSGDANANILSGGDGNDVLNGNNGDDILRGGNGDDTLNGGVGNDTLNGGVGNDTMNGGAGNDIYYVDSSSDQIVEAASGGTDVVRASASFVLPNNVENLRVEGIANIDGTGNALDNIIYGNPGNNQLSGLDGNDTIYGSAGGNDTVLGGNGDDTIIMGTALTAADKIDGGAGTDIVVLNGDYSASVKFTATTIVNVETLELTAGHSYKFISNDATVGTGLSMTVDGSNLGSSDTLNFNGAAETDGSLVLVGGRGNDVLVGGSGNDTITGGAGADSLTGGAGSDHFVYTAANQSSSTGYDTITGFSTTADVFDLNVTVNAIDAKVASGALSAATFDSDLTTALSGHLVANDAILFTPTTGDLAGKTFLIVDANGTAGYQAHADFVFQLASPVNIASLGTADFI